MCIFGLKRGQQCEMLLHDVWSEKLYSTNNDNRYFSFKLINGLWYLCITDTFVKDQSNVVLTSTNACNRGDVWKTIAKVDTGIIIIIG